MADQLSAKDWIDQGIMALIKSGFTALKAEPLAKAMGVSRGSFYWHFKDIGAYHAAILKHWRDVATEQVIADLEVVSKDRDALALLLRRAFSSTPALENAVRTWATVDPDGSAEHPPMIPASTHTARVSHGPIRPQRGSRRCRPTLGRTRIRMSSRRRPMAAGAPAPGPTGRAARGSSPRRRLVPR